MKRVVLVFLVNCSAIFATTVSVKPADVWTRKGERFSVEIVVKNVSGLIGAEVKLVFDPEKLKAERVREGSLFADEDDILFTLIEEGEVIIDAVKGTGTEEGTGTVVSIEFLCISENPEGSLAFSEVILVGTEGSISIDEISGANIYPYPLSHFDLTAPSTATAGKPFELKIVPIDVEGRVSLAYQGTVSLSVSSGEITPSYVSGFYRGSLTVEATLYKAGTTTIFAKDYVGTQTGTTTLHLSPSTLNRLSISQISSQIAGIGFEITVAAEDAYGNPVKAYATITDTSGTIQPTEIAIDGSSTFTVIITAQGTTSITLFSGTVSAVSNLFYVNHNELHHFFIEPITSQIAGIGFEITVAAEDAYGNPVKAYATITDTSGTIQPTEIAIDGSSTFTVIITAQGTTSITLFSGTVSAVSNLFYVDVNPPRQIKIEPIEDQIQNKGFPITVYFLDQKGSPSYSSGLLKLSDTTGSLYPSSVDISSQTEWKGTVTISYGTSSTQISVELGETGTKSNPFAVLIKNSDGGVKEQNGIRVMTEPNITDTDYYILITEDPLNRPNPHTSPKDSIEKAGKDYISIYGVDCYNRDGELIKQFQPSAEIKIAICYKDENDDSWIDGYHNIHRDSLFICCLDESEKEWKEVVSTFNPEQKEIAIETDHLSVFALFGKETPALEDIRVYPNPWRADRDREKPYIEFEMPRGSKLSIYTISGRLIKEFFSTNGFVKWYLDNREKSLVSSGIYIYLIENNGKKRLGKVGVIR